jgi:hypothetical protein
LGTAMLLNSLKKKGPARRAGPAVRELRGLIEEGLK